ncbi:beta-lactamase [Gluconacetobacter diazotrophicus PA1 5]|uniref:Beta-lactamase family protein n=1 Tax=Gluconacetobacter diazotrophicus TaxID=33996 RepID=A0A7W4I4W7_GLUDI|nr:serine hydrolase domain-containing protein [Gluconacetobacter diazotrophicus]ACI52654.1 beta-lactamase [Gluconacetobacter diazotrophicus PA1 5]MBB2156407.1 beta-lactamase family protein [Gluconacetobacter diazotrophicus]TWB06061.1 CubicO group peptidase (beta-lactamase class C family) [Gluconacetobacter diazotrophicus]
MMDAMSIAMPTGGMAERVDQVVRGAVARGRLVGAVVLVAVDGAVVVRCAAGLANREGDRPMATDTLMRLASLTKPVVTAVALRLAERGMLGLDDAVTRFLPDFRPACADGSVPVITLRHLLTHTAGLSYGFAFPRDDNPYVRAGVSDGIAEPGLALADNLARLSGVPLSFAPGQGWQYSLALDVMGGVLERAGDAPLPELVRQYVGAPLGWARSGFSVPDPTALCGAYADARPVPVAMGARYAMPRQLPGGRISEIVFAPDRVLDSGSYPSGGAGMVGTAEEFLTFVDALRAGGGPILSADSAALFGRNAIGDLPMGMANDGMRFAIGAATVDDPARARTPMSRGAFTWGGVYGHQWIADPARGVSIVMLSNTALAGMAGAYPDAVRDAVYGVG